MLFVKGQKLLFTKEQQEIIDYIVNCPQDSLIAVNAVAGSGKTATCHGIINALKPQRGFYTAFNKAIVTESASRFGFESNNEYKIECRTIHSLAYSYIRPESLKPFFQFQIFDFLDDGYIGYDERQKIFNIISNFCNSPFLTIEDFLKNNKILIQNLVHQIIDNSKKSVIEDFLQIIERGMIISDKDIDEGVNKKYKEKLKEFTSLIIKYTNYYLYEAEEIPHDVYLKQFHIKLAHGICKLKPYDILILDECQDTSGVTLEIFKLLKAKKKIILGDLFQNIYSFRNTVNAFEELQPDKILSLTRCFRCNEDIARRVANFGQNTLSENFKFDGNPNVSSKTNENTKTYLTRTNAHLVLTIYMYIKEHKPFNLGPNKEDEIFSLPIALHKAALNQEVERNFSYLKNLKKRANANGYHGYEKFLQYVTEQLPDNIQICTASKLLRQFALEKVSIIELKEKVEKRERCEKEDYLSTIHSFKGLESDIVIVAEEVNEFLENLFDDVKERIVGYKKIPKNLEELREFLTKSEQEELNLYYIAMSRARVSLINSRMESFNIKNFLEECLLALIREESKKNVTTNNSCANF